MYANEIYLGHGNYGVEAASRYYFGKSVKDVTLAEAALLAGIVQRPEDQSPFRNPALGAAPPLDGAAPDARRGLHHRDAQREAAEAEPLPSAPSLEETVVGPYFCEEIRQYLEKTYGEKDLYRRGLRVESTLDPRAAGLVRGGARLGAAAASRGVTASIARATCAPRATGPRRLRGPVVGGRASCRGATRPRRRDGRVSRRRRGRPDRREESSSPRRRASPGPERTRPPRRSSRPGDLVTVTHRRRERTAARCSRWSRSRGSRARC